LWSSKSHATVSSVRTQIKILLVEDDALIAMEMEERLTELGYVVLGPAATVAAAEAAVAAERPDAALLDANLAGCSSVGLGEALKRQGVRVAFCTGYDEIRDLPAHMADAPILTKPVSDQILVATLRELMAP
jgi:DNA-binding response OmpR family regulator